MKKTMCCLASCVVLASTGVASADVACPTSPTASDAIIRISGTVPSFPTSYQYFVGNTAFFGGSSLAVCVMNIGRGFQQLYLLTDTANSLLSSLPKAFNHMCLGPNDDTLTVVQQTESLCGHTMTPLNYNGNTFVVYGQGGNDHLHGGNGVDRLYGGVGADNLADETPLSGSNPIHSAILWGESGPDRLYGSAGSGTWMLGGDGDDGLRDRGGSSDVLLGEGGNECCMYDASFAALDCGPGVDRRGNVSGTTGCETLDTTCTLNEFQSADCR